MGGVLVRREPLCPAAGPVPSLSHRVLSRGPRPLPAFVRLRDVRMVVRNERHRGRRVLRNKARCSAQTPIASERFRNIGPDSQVPTQVFAEKVPLPSHSQLAAERDSCLF